jgi:NAD(P)-dependent dehydrogenase (short-subunit alcohol dehydrogenase family)
MVERAGRVEGKVAIVTGAGSTPGPGIGTGKATAVVLGREGASVLLVDLYPERAEETRRMIEAEGGKAAVFGGDITQAVFARAAGRVHEHDAVRGGPARHARHRLGRGLGGHVPGQRRSPVDHRGHADGRVRRAQRDPAVPDPGQ